jgi:hypothetical protein
MFLFGCRMGITICLTTSFINFIQDCQLAWHRGSNTEAFSSLGHPQPSAHQNITTFPSHLEPVECIPTWILTKKDQEFTKNFASNSKSPKGDKFLKELDEHLQFLDGSIGTPTWPCSELSSSARCTLSHHLNASWIPIYLNLMHAVLRGSW